MQTPSTSTNFQQRKRGVLMNCLGTKGQRRFPKFPELDRYPDGADDYTKALLKLEKEFGQHKNKRSE